jgi:hypothetical protein
MSPLETIQTDIFRRIKSADYFADISVFIFRPRSSGPMVQVQSQVDKALAGLISRAGKTGAAVIVQMPLATSQNPDVPGPRLTFNFAVSVFERPMVNMDLATGTLKSAEEIATEVLRLLHQWKPNPSQILTAAQNAIIPVEVDSNTVAYECRLEQMTGLIPLAKAAAPVIDVGSPTAVVMTSTSPSATILYSLDGSYPSIEFTGPFDGTGAQIRALAQSAGLADSNISEKQL